MFTMLVAAVCHDWFTNVYNEKTETPLGILFKNQSVMENHQCKVAINISAMEESNTYYSDNLNSSSVEAFQ